MNIVVHFLKLILNFCKCLFKIRKNKEVDPLRNIKNAVGMVSNEISIILDCLEKRNNKQLVNLLNNKDIFFNYTQSGDSLLHVFILTNDRFYLQLFKEAYLNSNANSVENWLSYVNKENFLKQTPLHWSCTKNNLSMIQFLVENGANVNARDSKGITPLIMCAQNSNIAGAFYLFLSNADITSADFEGDNGLHWSLYKGNLELCKFFIYHGLDINQKDSFNQTPLHFASLSGNTKCIDHIASLGAKLNVYDNNGKTALMISAGRRHYAAVNLLKYIITKKWIFYLKYCVYSMTLAHFYFAIVPTCGIIWGNYYLYFQIFRNYYFLYSKQIAVCILTQFMFALLYIRVSKSNPGKIKQNKEEFNEFINKIKRSDPFPNFNGVDTSNPFYQICWICEIIKPNRTFHCFKCNACIEEKDHHCIFIRNCVGKLNRVKFLMYMMTYNAMVAISIILFYETFNKYVLESIISLFILVVGSFTGLSMATVMLWNGFKNQTLYEALNWKKIKYLQNLDGSYFNSNESSKFKNILHYFNY